MNTASTASLVLRPKTLLSRIVTLVVVVVPFLATIYAIVTLWQRDVTIKDLILMFALYLFTGFGVTIGFHRFATHRSFQSNRILEFILLAAGTMAVEGPVIRWVANHWKHHKHADQPGDPHSPMEGLFHAHVGWMFSGTGGIPEVDAKMILKDPIARFMSVTFPFWALAGMAFPYLIDGWRGVLWGGLVRVFITHHITWSVNSVCHQFGKRSFETPDQSHNQWFVGLVGLGEGWHNNHHAFPESAFHGLSKGQVDLSGYMILFLEKVRLIRGVRRVSPERMAKRKIA